LLLFLVPGLGRLALRGRRPAWDGLTLLRNLYLTFTASIVLFGVVVVLATSGAETEPAGVWVAALLVVAVLCLAMAEKVGRRPLDGRDLVSLAGSHQAYRRRPGPPPAGGMHPVTRPGPARRSVRLVLWWWAGAPISRSSR